MAFQFSPDYKFMLAQSSSPTRNGPTPQLARGGNVYSLQTLQTCRALLATSGTVGQLEATFTDPGQRILEQVAPNAMNLVQLSLKNYLGQWGVAWTGYVDSAHHLFDPTQGDMVQLTCTSPYKLWEITHLTPTAQQQLAIQYAQNVKATTVYQASLGYVGYPTGMSFAAANADGGSGYQSSGLQTAFTTPDEQTWSSVMQALMANTGIEWFFDEGGNSIWRQVGFLSLPTPPSVPRVVQLGDIMHADLAQDDSSIVTSIEVRWGTSPMLQTAGTWQGPANMVAHLQERHIVVYAPWLLSQAAAQNLATILGLQYSATILQGSTTIPADPLYQVGTVIQVPALLLSNPNASSYYYLASVGYQLEWGGQWTMTLGLQYGRGRDQSFPYLGQIQYPIVTTDTGGPLPPAAPNFNGQPVSTTNNAQLTNPYQVVPDNSLPTGVVSADPILFPTGTIIQLTTGTASGGVRIGPSANGEYKTVDAAPYTGQLFGMAGLTAPVQTAYVTIISSGQTPAPTTTGTVSTVGNAATSTIQQTQTAVPGGSTSSPTNLSTARTLAQRALAYAITLAGPFYSSGAAGPNAWDCSGLVYWAFKTVGYNPPGFLDSGPNGEYYWFLSHGAKAIAVSQAQVGDLLFCQGAAVGYTATQAGFGHVGWLSSLGPPALIYSAMGTQWGGLGTAQVALVKDDVGHPISLALDMSGVQ